MGVIVLTFIKFYYIFSSNTEPSTSTPHQGTRTMLTRTTLTPTSENHTDNPLPLIVLLFIGVVVGCFQLFSYVEQSSNAKTIKSQAAYYDALGATKAFWDQ